MMNWVLVAVGLAVIGFGVLLFRNASSVSSLQQRQASAMRYPDSMQRRFTPRLVRLVAVGFAVWGALAVVAGGFFADKL